VYRHLVVGQFRGALSGCQAGTGSSPPSLHERKRKATFMGDSGEDMVTRGRQAYVSKTQILLLGGNNERG
jgi:hypothetical protein